jgi:hypothetical protein
MQLADAIKYPEAHTMRRSRIYLLRAAPDSPLFPDSPPAAFFGAAFFAASARFRS